MADQDITIATLRPGTRIETEGCPAMGGFGAVPPEPAVIVKPRAQNLPIPGPGYHLVKFADGARLFVHQTGFRVVDNRAGVR